MIFPWQQSTWQSICRAYNGQRLAHALLLTGPKGLGKVTFARALAQLVLCQEIILAKSKLGVDSDQTLTACGHCRSCHWMQQRCHPDVSEITLIEDSKHIKIEQIRQLRDRLYQTAHGGGYQVVVLFPAQQLNRAAANALLKTLEEPVGQVILILVADQLSNLPVTIISRCQRLTFNPVALTQALPWLQEQLPQHSTAELQQLLQLAEHAPLQAKYLATADFLALRDQILKHLIHIDQHQSNPVTISESLLKCDLELLLYAFMTLIIDLLRLQYSVTAAAIYNQDCYAQLRGLTNKRSAATLTSLLSTLTQMNQFHLSQANPNWQLYFERFLLEWEQSCHAH